MRIARYAGNGTIQLVDGPEPIPGPGEVVVETAVSAICGSELHAYRGAAQAGNGGHEAVGTIAALGEGVVSLKVGQRVGVSAISGCGKCAYCAKGQYTYCSQFKFYGSMHAERFLASAIACHPLLADLSWEAAVLLTGDGLGVPYHTSLKIASPQIKTVAVLGVGPIGLGNVLLQAHLGRRVIAVDLSPYRLDLAKRLGASELINASQEDTASKLRALTGGVGPDVCIEAAGQPETALACFHAVRTAGMVVFNGEQGPLPISPSDQFIRRDITAVGSWFYHFSEFPLMCNLYRSGLRVLDLISHRIPFQEADAAYRQFSSRQSGKVLLTYA
ncbi:MAG: zinc-binding dehydrogenase [Anaerolineaceae bacterium]|nr:zinc-binding dehydrogenase [Anaerolineaceae bacterium]